MAPVASRTLGAVASLKFSPFFSNFSSRRALGFQSSFLSQPLLNRQGFSTAGLKWKIGRKRDGDLSIRCEAAVAEKEITEEAGGEKYEYQAEVGSAL